jgi:hypothetical protein
MASYGLVTLTNSTEDRDRSWIEGRSGNLIAVALTPAAIRDGLREAVSRSRDLHRRFAHASVQGFPANPNEAFSDAVDFSAS